MNYLNKEFINSLIYRHRGGAGEALYLSFFGFNQQEEPFPIFPTKLFSIHESVDRYIYHCADCVEQQRNIMMFLSVHGWSSKSSFEYIHAQLRLRLPQNILVCILNLAGSKGTSSWLLREIMRNCGIAHIAKEDSTNLKKFKRFVEFQWNEYRKKFFFILFRSDNLSFSQMKYLRDISVIFHDLPLTYFLLEGSKVTYHKYRDLRKETIDSNVYDIYFVFHRGSFDTVCRNMEQKLSKPIGTFITPEIFRKLFYLSDGSPVYSLMHSVLQRMMARKIHFLDDTSIFEEIVGDIRKENDLFALKAPEYKKKLEHQDYIFPPELLRDGPSITEARRFFRWMGWPA